MYNIFTNKEVVSMNKKLRVYNIKMDRRIILFSCLVIVLSSLSWSQSALDLLYNAEEGLGHQNRPLNLANRVGTIIIDTDSMTIYGDITPTRYGEDVFGVCVFRFSYVNLGPGVNVVIQGKRPLAILSAGDMVISTNLTVAPGTLGGAFGGEGGKGGGGGKAGSGMGAEGGFGGNAGAGGIGYDELSNGHAGAVGIRGSDSVPGTWEGEFMPSGFVGENGKVGKNGQCLIPPNSLLIAGGSGGGGGGGGGGTGGSGDGGGGGGGGSGGGGGGAFTLILPTEEKSGEGGGIGSTIGGAGGDGGKGGNGGTGALGGDGGDNYPLGSKEIVSMFIKDYGENGGDGGKGGTGGGALILGARGMLTIANNIFIDVSAAPPQNGTAGTGGGAGGRGGYGTPGMVKLQGSILNLPTGTQRVTVKANYSGDLFAESNGRVTLITNMSQYLLSFRLPKFTNQGTLVGLTTNNSVLRDFNIFNPEEDTPLIPELISGLDVEGYLTNNVLYEDLIESAVPELEVRGVELIRITGSNSYFEGFDHIILVNKGEMNLSRVYIKVGNDNPVPIGFGTGDLDVNERWTTLITTADPLTPVDVYVLDAIPGEGEGIEEGIVEGIIEGEGQIEGSIEGINEGEGIIEGIVEGTVEGEGITEGTVEGGVEGEGITEGEPCTYHSADLNKDWTIVLTELLRVIQLFNSNAYHCDAETEDGYATGSGSHDCSPHDSDYSPVSWKIELNELLRLIQFFNSTGSKYHCDSNGEDGYAPGGD